MTLAELATLLQISIGPAILISGSGLLLLSMTNRLGRIIDRARLLARECRAAPAGASKNSRVQLEILRRRAKLMRLAIVFISLAALLASVLMIALFVYTLLQRHNVGVIAFLFIGCLASLLIALGYFLRDIFQSLDALEMEVSEGA